MDARGLELFDVFVQLLDLLVLFGALTLEHVKLMLVAAVAATATAAARAAHVHAALTVLEWVQRLNDLFYLYSKLFQAFSKKVNSLILFTIKNQSQTIRNFHLLDVLTLFDII